MAICYVAIIAERLVTQQLKVKEVNLDRRSLKKHTALVERDGMAVVLTLLAERMEEEKR